MVDFLSSSLGKKLQNVSVISDALVWVESFDETLKKKVIDYIQTDQLKNKGVDQYDRIIGYYSYATEILSNGRKKQGTPYTLEDTGEFFRSMYIDVFNDGIIIQADGEKGEDNLFTKFGQGITGLNEESVEKLRQEIRESFINRLQQILAES